jgi:fructokinase
VRIGVDIGGTKIEAVALARDGSERGRRRVHTPAHEYQALLDAVASLVRGLEEEAGAAGASVGVAVPGARSPATGLVMNSHATGLNGHAFDADLAARIGRAVRIANDANCFALSEATDGAGAGADTVFGVILGTGVGGGVVCFGRPLHGANAIAGEWGHNPLPWPRDEELPGPACGCGGLGHIESWLSGPGLERDHASVAGERLEPAEIDRRADGGDADCEETLRRYEDRLARALATAINLLDPHVIVLGGGLSHMARLYENVPRLWGRWVFSDRVDTRLVPNRWGDASGVRGAAALWPRA